MCRNSCLWHEWEGDAGAFWLDFVSASQGRRISCPTPTQASSPGADSPSGLYGAVPLSPSALPLLTHPSYKIPPGSHAAFLLPQIPVCLCSWEETLAQGGLLRAWWRGDASGVEQRGLGRGTGGEVTRASRGACSAVPCVQVAKGGGYRKDQGASWHGSWKQL